MARAPKPIVPIHQLKWATLGSAIIASNVKYPELLDDNEYTGEDGETIEEYNSRVRATNNLIVIQHKASVREAVATVKEMCKEFKGKNVLQDLMALWGQPALAPVVLRGKVVMKDTFERIAENAVSGKVRYANGSIVSLDVLKGMLGYLKIDPRADINGCRDTATTPTGHIYAVCRPLLPSVWKFHHGIMYSQYGDDFKMVVGPELAAFQQYIGTEFDYTVEQLSLLRMEAIANHPSGTAVGCYQVATPSNTEFNALPRLVKLCLLQLWVYAPNLYQNYAMMSLVEADAKPVPIICPNVFESSTKLPNIVNSTTWDML